MVLQPMHVALPLHPELTHIVEQGIQMDGVIARQCEIIRCDADVGDFIDERIRQGVVLVFQVDLVDPKILDAYDERLAILHLLDGGGHRVDDFLKDRGVAMIHMTEEKVEVCGAIRIDNVGCPNAGDLQPVQIQDVLVQVETSNIGPDGVDVTQPVAAIVAQRQIA